MSSIEIVLSALKCWNAKRKSVVELIVGIIVIVSLTISALIIIKPLSLIAAVLGTLVLLCLWVGIWFFWSGRIIFPSGKYEIIFCINNDSAAHDCHEKLFIKLKSQFDNLNLTKKINIRTIGTDIISNRKQAVAYRENQNVDLIIWGNALGETIDNKPVVNYTLSFTYRLNKTLRAKLMLFQTDFMLVVGKKNWTISLDNTLSESIKIVNNLTEAALFMFGMHLFTDDKLEDAYTVFCALRDVMAGIGDDKFKHIVQGRINCIIVEVCFLLGKKYYWGKQYEKAIEYFTKILQFSINKFYVCSNLATLYYLIGDMKAAGEWTDKARKIHRNHPIIFLNTGFFRIHEERYQAALFWYKKIYRLNHLDEVNVSLLIEFFDEHCLLYKHEHAYIFALGLLNYKFFDQKKGISDLARFVAKARFKEKYNDMVRFAEDIIEADRYKRKKLKKQKRGLVPLVL